MTHLVKYNAARNALAEAHAIDEVKDIRDKAEAMAAYARQAKDTEMIQWVTEIKVRAERRAGQMLAEMPKAKGTQLNGKSIGGHIVVPPKNDEKTLADLGITKNESSRWQKLAGVSEEQFEHAIAAAKEVAGEVTTAAMLRAAKPESEKKEKKHRHQSKPKTGEKAESLREEIKAAQAKGYSMLASHCRLLLSTLSEQSEFSKEERDLLDQVVSAINKL